MKWSFSFFVASMRKTIKPIGRGSFMIDPNCTADDLQPSFSQNARSFIKARADNRLDFHSGFVFLDPSNQDRAAHAAATRPGGYWSAIR
jgi:hypothetical protein